MRSIVPIAAALAGCAIAGASAPAVAQSYRCASGGTIYYSDRPCSGRPPGKLTVYGPTRNDAAVTTYSAPSPRAGKMQEHVKYLSPQCASISEAIRTAPSRGVRGDAIAGLHEEYRQKCQVEDQEARRQHGQDVAEDYQRQRAERTAAANERKQAQARADQCTGMRDVIATKRAREASLNPTEVDALRALERAYNERCIAR
jgi:hypothetical protein